VRSRWARAVRRAARLCEERSSCSRSGGGPCEARRAEVAAHALSRSPNLCKVSIASSRLLLSSEQCRAISPCRESCRTAASRELLRLPLIRARRRMAQRPLVRRLRDACTAVRGCRELSSGSRAADTLGEHEEGRAAAQTRCRATGGGLAYLNCSAARRSSLASLAREPDRVALAREALSGGGASSRLSPSFRHLASSRHRRSSSKHQSSLIALPSASSWPASPVSCAVNRPCSLSRPLVPAHAPPCPPR